MTEPLEGDESRQAVSPMRGYHYQILRSVYEWLELAPGERLFLEGAEDFDRVSADDAQATQVKHTETAVRLTLRSPGALAAIHNFWVLSVKNPGRSVRLNFLTTAQVGVEADDPFGPGRPGLQLWEEASGAPEDELTLRTVEVLKRFLVDEGRLDADLIQFLSSASASDTKTQLIDRIAWLTSNRRLVTSKQQYCAS